MQTISATFLKSSICPGKAPIFIVAPSMEDGAAFALALSSLLIVPRHVARISTELYRDHNYFTNREIIRLLKNVRQNGYMHKRAEFQQRVQLLLEESITNGKLWGLLMDFPVFFEAGIDTLYEQAHYIFIYNQNISPEHSQRLISLLNEQAHQCSVFHVNQWVQLPQLILKQLSFSEEVSTKIFSEFIPLRKKKRPYALRPEKDYSEEDEYFEEEFYDAKSNVPIKNAAASDISALNEYNLLRCKNAFIEGRDLLCLLYCSKPFDSLRLSNKIIQYNESFLTAPLIVIAYDDESLLPLLQDTVGNTRNITFEKVQNGLGFSLSHIISEKKPPYIVFDDLTLSFSLPDFLLPLKSETVAFTFCKAQSAVNSNRQPEHVIADILVTDPIEGNIAFTYNAFMYCQGLDAGFAGKNAIWDFAIRALNSQNKVAIEVPAAVADSILNEESLPPAPVNTIAFNQIVEKHKDLFQRCLDQIVERLSVSQHLPQAEIKSLQDRIGGLQTLLSHTKQEVKALNELSSELQKRIYTLENQWFYRLGRKIIRLKKIFFKKQTSGTGTLKRILQFLAFTFSQPGFLIVRKVLRNAFKKLYLLAEIRRVKIVYLDEAASENIETYHDWIKNKTDPERLRKEFDLYRDQLTSLPKISIVMPVFDPPAKFLKQAIDSVVAQSYENWELCIADDCSTDPKVRRILEVYMAKESRIKVVFRKENGHISACSNSALQLATGAYVLLMDHDDLLAENCLFEVVRHLNEYPLDEIIYSDEDKVNEDGGHSVPHFKPDWAPHSLLSRNYFGHVVVIKKEILDKIGGFRLGFEGSQDYDLILRATEQTKHIGHIPKVLYHWRIHKKSAAQSEDVKPYAYIAAKKALEEALVRRHRTGEVTYLSGLRGYRIKYNITKPGKVSIVIPTKDQVNLLRNTLESIFHQTDYIDFEIIVLNNNSSSSDFFKMMKDYEHKYPEQFRCIDANFPFNFAKLMNIGVAASSGDYVLFLNNDVEVIHSDWLSLMVSHAQHKEIAAVGVKLLYPDDHIQHAGVIVGLGGVAGHAFVNQFKDEPGYFNYIQSVNNFSAVTAACMLFRKEVYEEVGGMEELFEVEYNDVDLCLKFITAGYYNIYLPDVELYHYESATRGHPHQSKESWERHVREIALFKSKWQHIIDRDPFYNPNLNIGAHNFSLNFSA